MSDYRILLDVGLTVKLWKALSMNVNFDMRYDSDPFEDVKNHDVLLTNGLQIEF